jgi:hypothetical protein
MKKTIIITILFFLLSSSCGPAKPSWDRKDRTQVTQNDEAILGILLSGLILFSLHTFTTR